MMMNSKTEAPCGQEQNENPTFGSGFHAADFAERVRLNQRKLRSDLKPQYDFIVCGSGSSGTTRWGLVESRSSLCIATVIKRTQTKRVGEVTGKVTWGTLEQARPDIESCQSPDSVFALEHM